MQASNKQRIHYLRADATALGGHLEEPIEKPIPTLVPVSLPAVGGFTTARSGAFCFEEIISCSAAYTRVSGQEHPDSSSSILATAVVENLNILEVVRADRIVAQLSISVPAQDAPIKFSVTGAAFEGLQIAGQACRPKLNADLQGTERADGLITREDAWRVGCAQTKTLLAGLKTPQDGATYQWALRRQQRMAAVTPPASGVAPCSLIDSLEGASRSSAHVLEIPGFGRFIFGELFVANEYVQLVGIRVDLGCPVSGAVGLCQVAGGWYHDC